MRTVQIIGTAIGCFMCVMCAMMVMLVCFITRCNNNVYGSLAEEELVLSDLEDPESPVEHYADIYLTEPPADGHQMENIYLI